MTLDYEIIASGSAGNCVRVEDMLFDVGVPYKKIRKHLYGIRYIFITHAHTDHLHKPTVISIQKEFPRIVWIGSYDVAYKIPIKEVVGDKTRVAFRDREVQVFECLHDVPTHGFVITKGDRSLIYATDTFSLENAPTQKYDYFFIESNHDETKIEKIRNTARKQYGYDAWKNAMRHLSTQKSKAFYYIHRRSKDSLWVELHKSERFY